MKNDLVAGDNKQQLFHHLIVNEVLEWLHSLYYSEYTTKEEQKSLLKEQSLSPTPISEWNQSLAKFNLLFPSSPKALEEQECILHIISSHYSSQSISDTTMNSKKDEYDNIMMDKNNRYLLASSLHLLFNPLMAMKMMSSSDDMNNFRATFSNPNINHYNFPNYISKRLYSNLKEEKEPNNDDSMLNLFTTQQVLPKCIETILQTWNEQEPLRKKTYSSHSWAPLERKIQHLQHNQYTSDDNDHQPIPEPPPPTSHQTPPQWMKNNHGDHHHYSSSDSLREKSWRILKKLDSDTIECVLSSDESLMQVDYFCKVLEKHIPNNNNNTMLNHNVIQQSLLLDNDYKQSQYQDWISQIEDRIPNGVVDDESNNSWYSLMTCLVSYCFGGDDCLNTFSHLFKQLDYYRSRLFKSTEDSITICEITPNLIDSVLSLEEQGHLEMLLVQLNTMLKSKSIGKRPINLLNWITTALLYDLYRAEQASFLKSSALDDVWNCLQSRIPILHDETSVIVVPFTFSPTFVIALLATRSYSNNSTLKPHPPCVDDFNSSGGSSRMNDNVLITSPSMSELLKECLKMTACDSLIKGAKLDALICHVLGNYYLGIEDGRDNFEPPNKIIVQSIIHTLSTESMEEILQENIDRDCDFNFLCSLSILIVKERMHNMKSFNHFPKFSLTLPYFESENFIFHHHHHSTTTTIHTHPALLNRHALVKYPTQQHYWYPLLINSKTNTQLLVGLKEQLEQQHDRRRRTKQCYFGSYKNLLYERLTSIRIGIDDKIDLLCFILKHVNNPMKNSSSKEESIRKLIVKIQRLTLEEWQ